MKRAYLKSSLKRKAIIAAVQVLLSCILSVFSLSACQTGQANALTAEDAFRAVGEKLSRAAIPDVGWEGFEWTLIGLEKNGLLSEKTRQDYLQEAETYVASKGTNRLHPGKSTENSRVILGLLAAGADPENIGSQNLVEGLLDLEYVTQQGNNGPIWALIALTVFQERAAESGSVPLERSDVSSFVEELIPTVLGAAQENGGFSMMNGEPDTDLTAMAIQALSPYREREDVAACIEKALTHLSNRQKEDGSFEGYGVRSSESISQVILALSSLGVSPDRDERFIKNGYTLTDALMRYWAGDGFRHLRTDEAANALATEQAYLALTARSFAEQGKPFSYGREADAAD